MLVPNQQTIQLGNVRFGQPHEFKYIVSNSSPTTLTVEKLQLGCNSCTKASMMKREIPPGETSVINVTFTPGSIGIQRKNISVLYRDGMNISQNLELKFLATSHA